MRFVIPTEDHPKGETPDLLFIPIFLKFCAEPPLGLEPRTFTLQKCCSTIELRWQNFIRISRTLDIVTKSKIWTISEQNRCSTSELPRQMVRGCRKTAILPLSYSGFFLNPLISFNLIFIPISSGSIFSTCRKQARASL